MDQEQAIEPQKKQMSLALALGFAILLASTMVITTLFIFLKSNAYQTVKQIQTGVEVINSLNSDDIDITTPIKANDIDEYSNIFQQKIKILDDYTDFGPSDTSENALGM
jgi:hypothetical protein